MTTEQSIEKDGRLKPTRWLTQELQEWLNFHTPVSALTHAGVKKKRKEKKPTRSGFGPQKHSTASVWAGFERHLVATVTGVKEVNHGEFLVRRSSVSLCPINRKHCVIVGNLTATVLCYSKSNINWQHH